MTLATAAGLVLTEEFSDALERLERGENLFLTGKAGTGKSTLIRHFMESTDRRVIVAAPTGIAALNVDGYTIHRLFSFGPSVTVEQVRSHRYYPGRFAKTLKWINTLIIDEASMVRADLFDSLAAALELYGPHPGRPFGGIQVVLVGDLYQLPPVVMEAEAEYFRTRYDSPYFYSADSYTSAPFPVVALTHVFRQAGDDRLVSILNSVRDGALLADARSHLNERTDPDFKPPIDEFWLTLTTTNRIADARNRAMLGQLDAPEHVSHARVAGDLDSFDSPTSDTLTYKVGAQIMLLTNESSWVNGTIARIVAADTIDGVPAVTIELPDGTTATVGPHTWEITQPVVTGGRLHHATVGTYTQLPFRLAWAITIHKSQGQTLDRMVVDLTGGTFADGQLYVALSRCTSMAGLVLHRNVLPRDLKVDPRIRRFLRTAGTRPTPAGTAYLGVCFVGSSGRMWRPRPVEIAIVTDDGRELSTLVNPMQDLGSARTEFGIGAGDVQLAPTLADAWPALTAFLHGYALVGVDIDRTLGHLDFELKRLGRVERLPLGTEASDAVPTHDDGLRAPTALERARHLRELSTGAATDAPDVVTDTGELPGYLLPRWSDEATFLVGGTLPDGTTPACYLTGRLAEIAARGPLGPATRGLVEGLQEHLGTRIEGLEFTGGDHDPAALLVRGARVCFTGSAIDSEGREWDRDDMTALARAHGLEPVKNVTKTKCDVLVAAEPGSQSNKMRTAAAYGKPILSIAAFLAWAGGGAAGQPTDDAAPVRVCVAEAPGRRA